MFVSFCINFRPDLRDYDQDKNYHFVIWKQCINFRPDLRD